MKNKMQHLPKIYAAGKIWHAPKFRELRDTYGFTLTSRWIDIQGDSSSPAIYKGKEISRREIWEMCLRDVLAADIIVIWCGDTDEEMHGAIMEAGHAMATGKRVFCVNTCDSFSPCEISDVAFTHHPLWYWIREDGRLIDPLEGFSVAIAETIGISEMESNVIPGPWGITRVR